MILPRDDDPPAHSSPPIGATHPQNAHAPPPFGATHPPQIEPHNSGLSAGAVAAIVLAVFLVVSAVAWVVFNTLRARRLGLPSPTVRSYIPFLPNNKRSLASSAALEPTRPSGGLVSRVFGQNTGYSGAQTRSERTRALGDNEWDDRMEDELEYRGASGRHGNEPDRGRSRSRDGRDAAPYQEASATPAPNPFDRDVQRVKKDGFGDVGVRGGRPSMDSVQSERRSVFREGV